ncbi:MAG: TIGR01212 family radical SAM protein [Lachnospiraceae bacterium]|nr:TIGR01212 family radical SAM protein [Lachnospiraceae bacterium]
MDYISLNKYLRDTFGEKVYKIALDGGFTCPNRDGKIGYGGCIFCSGEGSGDFAENASLSITEQIERGKSKVEKKMPSGKRGKYIAYFQAFTSTYGPIDKLRRLFTEAINHPDVVAISIGTRPDCLGLDSTNSDILDLLSELNHIKPVWIELGLQTTKEDSVKYIRRGYPTIVYDNAVVALRERNINVITHVILGLPGETKEDMIRTVKHVAEVHSDGIKLQLLHVLKGTDLAKDYEMGNFQVLTLDEYVDIVVSCLKVLPPEMVIHRITGDGNKNSLIAPLWSGDKKRVLNTLNAAIRNA